MTKTIALKYIYYESLLLGFLPFCFSFTSFKFYTNAFFKYWSYVFLIAYSVSIGAVTVISAKMLIENTPHNLIVLVFLLCQNTFFQLQFVPLFYQLTFKRERLLKFMNKATEIVIHSFGMTLPEKFFKQLTAKLLLNFVFLIVIPILFSWVYEDRVSFLNISQALFDCSKFMILSNIHFVSFNLVSILVENVFINLTNDFKRSKFFLNEKVVYNMNKLFDLYEYTKELESIFAVSCFAVTTAVFVILISNVSSFETYCLLTSNHFD